MDVPIPDNALTIPPSHWHAICMVPDMTIATRSEIGAESPPVLGRGAGRNAAALQLQGKTAAGASGTGAAATFQSSWQAQFASLAGSDSDAEMVERVAGTSAGLEANGAGNPAAISTPAALALGDARQPDAQSSLLAGSKFVGRAATVLSPKAKTTIPLAAPAATTGSTTEGKAVRATSASETEKPKLAQNGSSTAESGLSSGIGSFWGTTPPVSLAAEPVPQPAPVPTLLKAPRQEATPLDQDVAAGQEASRGKEETLRMVDAEADEALPVSGTGGQSAGQTVKLDVPEGQDVQAESLDAAQLSASAGRAAASGEVSSSTAPKSGELAATLQTQVRRKSDTSQNIGRDAALLQKTNSVAHATASAENSPPVPAAVTDGNNLAVGAHNASSRAKADAPQGALVGHSGHSTASVTLDVSARLANPAVVQTAASSAGPSADRTALRETFTALDAEPGTAGPTWTRATPHQAEAGFKDPVLGWVGVRADASGGGVHAAVVPGSAQAAEELGKHMDGIHSYLAEQHMPIDSLGMDAPGGMGLIAVGGRGAVPGAHSEMDQAGYQGSNLGSGQNGQQQSDSGSGAGADQAAAGQMGANQNGTNQDSPDQKSPQGWMEPVGASRSVPSGVSAAASGRGFEVDGQTPWRNGDHISLVA